MAHRQGRAYKPSVTRTSTRDSVDVPLDLNGLPAVSCIHDGFIIEKHGLLSRDSGGKEEGWGGPAWVYSTLPSISHRTLF